LSPALSEPWSIAGAEGEGREDRSIRFFISLTVSNTTTVRMVRNWRRIVARWQFCIIVIAIIRIIFKFH
jgi:hypothetical protein